MSQNFKLLEAFAKLAGQSPGAVPFSATFCSGRSGPRRLFTFAIHGDEIGSIPAALKMMEAIQKRQIQFDGNATFAIGNIDAVRNNTRFVTNDLNRAYNQLERGGAETQRARELAKLVDESDMHLDFHQTIVVTDRPFYMGEPDPRVMSLARKLDLCNVFIELLPAKTDQYGMIMAYARKAGSTHVCIELSKKGIDEKAESLALKGMTIALQSSEQATDAKGQIANLQIVRIVYFEPFASRNMSLLPGLKNFDRLIQGQKIGMLDSKRELFAARSGYILFPKYPMRDGQGQAIGELPISICEIAVAVEELELKGE